MDKAIKQDIIEVIMNWADGRRIDLAFDKEAHRRIDSQEFAHDMHNCFNSAIHTTICKINAEDFTEDIRQKWCKNLSTLWYKTTFPWVDNHNCTRHVIKTILTKKLAKLADNSQLFASYRRLKTHGQISSMLLLVVASTLAETKVFEFHRSDRYPIGTPNDQSTTTKMFNVSNNGHICPVGSVAVVLSADTMLNIRA